MALDRSCIELFVAEAVFMDLPTMEAIERGITAERLKNRFATLFRVRRVTPAELHPFS